nr:phosphatidylglycerol lysyltransferase domain-containing protein [Candidatus Sigynarchaeota archaeon]
MAAPPLRGYKPIELGDKVTFDEHFNAHPPDISEYTFTNLYMWRKHYKFAWKSWNGSLLLISSMTAGKVMLFPPIGGNVVAAIEVVKADATAAGTLLELHRVPELMVTAINESGMPVEIIEDRDNWDYVYATKDLSTLDGSKYAETRKKLSRFNRDHECEFKALDAPFIEKILKMQEEWCNLRGCDESEGLSDENSAIKDIMSNWNALKFTGGMLIEKDRIVAYSLGEKLNPGTIVVHVEKANPHPSFFGAYQAINKHFATVCAAGFEFINREQDIGEPGLRRAKESYNPVRMGKKYKVIVKGQ